MQPALVGRVEKFCASATCIHESVLGVSIPCANAGRLRICLGWQETRRAPAWPGSSLKIISSVWPGPRRRHLKSGSA